MPGKSKKPAGPSRISVSTPTGSQAETDSEDLPQEVAKEYDVGRIIGDGNFAVVRECIQR